MFTYHAGHCVLKPPSSPELSKKKDHATIFSDAFAIVWKAEILQLAADGPDPFDDEFRLGLFCEPAGGSTGGAVQHHGHFVWHCNTPIDVKKLYATFGTYISSFVSIYAYMIFSRIFLVAWHCPDWFR
jgi:hypothetical protein